MSSAYEANIVVVGRDDDSSGICYLLSRQVTLVYARTQHSLVHRCANGRWCRWMNKWEHFQNDFRTITPIVARLAKEHNSKCDRLFFFSFSYSNNNKSERYNLRGRRRRVAFLTKRRGDGRQRLTCSLPPKKEKTTLEFMIWISICLQQSVKVTRAILCPATSTEQWRFDACRFGTHRIIYYEYTKISLAFNWNWANNGFT